MEKLNYYKSRQDKLVLIDAKKCIGCKACILACLYEARQMRDGKEYYFGNVPTPYELKAYAAHVPGTIQKCEFCADCLDQGLKPYCVLSGSSERGLIWLI